MNRRRERHEKFMNRSQNEHKTDNAMNGRLSDQIAANVHFSILTF
jgi:hypothetical protein